jgi:hypothetical protein
MEIRAIIDVPKATLETAGLKPGDVLRVNVVDPDENGRALVEFGRWRVPAEIRFPVAAGDELWVRVTDTENRLTLQLIRSPSGEGTAADLGTGPVRVDPELLHDLQQRLQPLIATAERRGLSQTLTAEPRQTLEALGRALALIEPAADTGRLSLRLARGCEESGLFLEARLARAVTHTAASPDPAGPILASDLKARLLFLKAFAETAEGAALLGQNRELAALVRAAAAVLTEIRSAQEQIVRQAQASEPFHMIHMTLPMADGRTEGTLKIAYRGRRAGAKPERHRASLLLTLDRLGAVRADLLLLERGLNVAVFVSDPAARGWVERHVSEIQAPLAEFFENVRVQVSVSESRIARFTTEDFRPAGEGEVDVRV